jgi:DNA-binding transcriptional regulator YiaG
VLVPNFAGALKGEIQRLARKEVRANVSPLKKLVAALRRRVAQQRRLIADLEREVRRGAKSPRGADVHAASVENAETSQIRFSPAWVRQHRKKLKMSRRVYAKLIGVSAQSIFGWETGRSRPRRGALESWRRIREMGVREVKSLPVAERREGRKGRGRTAKKLGRPAGKKRGRPAVKKRGRPAAKKRGRPAKRSGMRRAAKKK